MIGYMSAVPWSNVITGVAFVTAALGAVALTSSSNEKSKRRDQRRSDYARLIQAAGDVADYRRQHPHGPVWHVVPPVPQLGEPPAVQLVLTSRGVGAQLLGVLLTAGPERPQPCAGSCRNSADAAIQLRALFMLTKDSGRRGSVRRSRQPPPG